MLRQIKFDPSMQNAMPPTVEIVNVVRVREIGPARVRKGSNEEATSKPRYGIVALP